MTMRRTDPRPGEGRRTPRRSRTSPGPPSRFDPTSPLNLGRQAARGREAQRPLGFPGGPTSQQATRGLDPRNRPAPQTPPPPFPSMQDRIDSVRGRDTSPTADAEIGRRMFRTPVTQTGRAPARVPRALGYDPQAGPPQIAGQGPTPPYASQAPIGSAMPSFGQNWVAQQQNPYASAMSRSGILNQTQTQWPQRFPGNVIRPQFTYGLNQNNPMWANAPQQGPGSPWDYYAGVPQQGLDMGNPPGNVPRAPGSTGFEGVHRQWNPNEINPQGMMGMMQQYGGQWPPGAIMNPLFNPLMGR